MLNQVTDLNRVNEFYTLLYTPLSLTIYKYNKNFYYLLFYIILSSISLFYFINNKKYYFIDTNIIQYNYYADFIVSISLQHFLIDLFFMKIKTDFKIHHIIGIIYILIVKYYNILHNITFYLSIGEISTFFLRTKIMVSKKYYNLHNNLFMINFFIFRICLLPLVLYKHYYYTIPIQLYLYPTILLLFDNLLHAYWIINMIKKNIKKII